MSAPEQTIIVSWELYKAIGVEFGDKLKLVEIRLGDEVFQCVKIPESILIPSTFNARMELLAPPINTEVV